MQESGEIMSEQKKRPAVGLALGGGSARGFAHIGVIRALQESRIPIDVVSGCSIGAIIGSIFCVGGDLELLLKICMQMKAREMMDLVVPRKGMVRGAKFENLIQLFTKNRDFEEMDVPFACSACDLWEGKTKIFTTGKVYPAVRASMSIPGVFEPKLIDGVMYVDGGVLDNVPVDAAKRLGADVVIGSDVCIHKAEPAQPSERLIDILYRATDLLEYQANKHQLTEADVLISPPVGYINQFEVEKSKECAQIGYETTMAKMDEIKQLIYGETEVQTGTV
jgi:NTE family protein